MCSRIDFLKGKDFMKLGQAIEHGNWQIAGMTAQRMQKSAKEAQISEFDRQLVMIKQAIAGRKKTEAQNILAAMIGVRVRLLKAEAGDPAQEWADCRDDGPADAKECEICVK